MEAKQAVKRMVENSGRSASDISRSIGKSRNYIGVLLSQGSDPRTANLARIAHECGYRLMLENEYDVTDNIELNDEHDGVRFLKGSARKLRENSDNGAIRAEDVAEVFQDPRATCLSLDDPENAARKDDARLARLRRAGDEPSKSVARIIAALGQLREPVTVGDLPGLADECETPRLRSALTVLADEVEESVRDVNDYGSVNSGEPKDS